MLPRAVIQRHARFQPDHRGAPVRLVNGYHLGAVGRGNTIRVRLLRRGAHDRAHLGNGARGDVVLVRGKPQNLKPVNERCLEFRIDLRGKTVAAMIAAHTCQALGDVPLYLIALHILQHPRQRRGHGGVRVLHR